MSRSKTILIRAMLTATLAALLAISAACSTGAKKTSHGVEITAGDGTQVRVEVVTDDIIHVEAVPKGAKFSTKVVLNKVYNVAGA